MSFYNFYADRKRNKLGVKLKKYQAKRIFDLGKNGNNGSKPRVLEFGPGDGYIADLSRNNKCEYTAVEASTNVVEKLKSRGFNIISSFVPPLPESLGKYDACYILHMIEHLKNFEEVLNLFNELKPHIEQDGKIIIACPEFNYWREYFYDCDYTHTLPFTGAKIKQLFSEIGYDVEFYSLYSGPVFGKSALLFYWCFKLFFPKFLVNFLSDVGGIFFIKRLYYTFIPNSLAVLKIVG